MKCWYPLHTETTSTRLSQEFWYRTGTGCPHSAKITPEPDSVWGIIKSYCPNNLCWWWHIHENLQTFVESFTCVYVCLYSSWFGGDMCKFWLGYPWSQIKQLMRWGSNADSITTWLEVNLQFQRSFVASVLAQATEKHKNWCFAHKSGN